MELKEGDWAIYNWLDDEGNDNWKIGRIVQTENSGLMYFNDDGTERSGYMPITDGVKAVDYSQLNDDDLFRIGFTIFRKSVRNLLNINAKEHVDFDRYVDELERRKILKEH